MYATCRYFLIGSAVGENRLRDSTDVKVSARYSLGPRLVRGTRYPSILPEHQLPPPSASLRPQHPQPEPKAVRAGDLYQYPGDLQCPQ